MTEITDLSTTDSSNTTVTGESIDGAIANMGRMDNTLQAILGLLARSIRTNVLRFLDNADPTKKVALDLSGLPTATERTWTAPYYSGTLGLVSDIRGFRYALTMTTNVADATNDVDVGAGSTVDSTGVISILLASSITKRIDATWAVGTNQGGLDTGVVGNNRYFIFLIRRPDTGVVDVLFSLSSTAPTLPANYTQFALIGNLTRSAGVNSRPYLPNEGKWSPTTLQPGAVSTSLLDGVYQKNGNLVTLTGIATYSATGTPATTLQVGNLPFVPSGLSTQCVGSAYYFDTGSQFYVLSAFVSGGLISFYADGGSGSFGAGPSIAVAIGDRLSFSVTYESV